MPLILTIAGSEAAELGPNAVKSFDRSGGVVGRGSQADWILPDAASLRMSQRHFRIDFRDGRYLLTDLSRNGTFVNGSDIPVGRDATVALNDGDVLEIAHYRIEVRIDDSSSPAPSPIPDHSVIGDDIDTGFRPTPGETPGVANDEVLDPLAWLGGNSDAPKPPPPPGAIADHSPITSDALDPMATRQAVPGANHGAIPENWNPFDDAPAPSGRAGPPSGPSTASSPDSPSVIPDNWDPFGGAGEDTPIGDDDRTVPPAPSRPDPRPAAPVASPTETPRADTPRTRAPEAAAESDPAHRTSAGGDALEAFLRGAGIDDQVLGQMTAEEFMELIGRLFRHTVRDIRELLLARANVKSGFRLDLTMIQPRENNPLKFSVGDEGQMMRNLFDTRGGGYLDAESAFDEAFRDIKAHQIGVLRGMRAAFDGVLDRFDPARIERDTRIRGIALSKKAVLWDAYMEAYPDIAREVKDGDWLLSNPDFQRGYSKPEDEK